MLTEQGRRQDWPLKGRLVSVGRERSNGIVLDDGRASVSRFHARLESDGRQWRVIDTWSTNRVRVNGELLQPDVAGARVLDDGDTLQIGSFKLGVVREESERLVFESEPVPAADARQLRSAVGSLADLSDLIAAPARLPREAEEAIERAKRVLSVVTTLGQRVAALTPIDEIIDTVVDLVFETTPAEHAALLLWDEDVARLVPKRMRSRDRADASLMRVSESLVQRAFAERVVVQMEPGGSPSASMHDLRLRSAVAVPLSDDTKAVGVIYADTSLHSRAFDAFGVSLLSALANHAAIALEQARLLRRVRQEERSRLKLEQYFARPVVDRILASEQTSSGFGMRAEEAEVTVLFCDMAGFTSRTEDMRPHEVLVLLNRCFSHLTEVVFQHEGTLDKYIGDCIMAVFGAPYAQPDHAVRAARAALGMREAIRKMNEGQPEVARIEFRIGIHSGRVVAGDVGHVTRRDWTVLGSTVNLAARMESSVAQRGQIVLTGDTHALLGAAFEVRPIVVEKLPKGISRDFAAFELVGVTGDPGEPGPASAA